MKNLLLICLVAAAGYFGYTKFFASETHKFSLASVDEKPIPKRVFFDLWKENALRECDNAKERHNLSPEQCREKITEKHSSCANSASAGAPEKISDKAALREFGRKYLSCVTPYFFCSGVEVHSEEEARKNCQ